jgi:mannose-6-phosphate isomerase-like protein (cupin superfamily)
MKEAYPFSSLPGSDSARIFEGYLYDDTGIAFIIVELLPGGGPRMHTHPYSEVFIVLEGEAMFTIDGQQMPAQGGEVLIVPPGTPHKFVNAGDGPLKQIGIHLSEKLVIDWLED